jgi:hypothetical protein
VISPHHSSTGEVNLEGALAWRSANFALKKSIEIFEHVRAQMEGGYDICMAVCIIPIAPFCPTCVVPSILESIMESLLFALALAMDISEYLYAELMDGSVGDVESERITATYENAITIHGNILTTHNDLLNVLSIVSGIKQKTDKLARRHMQVVDCTNTTLGFVDNCRKPSCENPIRLCDGSFNYEYISQLKGGENHAGTM